MTATVPEPGDGAEPRPSASRWGRGTVLALVAVTLFLVLVPLTLGKPGLPPGLKADEAAYYLMAMSLARDGDLRFEDEDQRRLFEEFPYRPTRNLILMSRDGWESVYYGKPWLYPAFAAPAARLFGANGMVALNGGMLAAMIWLGASWLSRRIRPELAVLFAVGFYLVSAISPYVTWLQPEIFNALCVAAALYLGFERREWSSRRALVAVAAAGGLLVLAAYGKPMYAALALPLALPPLLELRWRVLVAWVVGSLLAGLFAIGGSVLLTGQPSAYLGAARGGVTICGPQGTPPELELRRQAVREAAAEPAGPETQAMPSGSWSWMFRIPPLTWGGVLENLGYFLWGRHAGFLVYFPFAALAVVLLLVHRPRRPAPWILLGSLLIVALYLLLFIAWNWQGGGGFVGNRYYVSVVPGFLYLLPAIGVGSLLVGWVAGLLLLGGMLVTPFSPGVPEPTLQAHTRNVPLRWLPLELSLRNVPGYTVVRSGDLRIVGRDDQVLEADGGLWLQGSSAVELLLLAPRPLERTAFLVRSPASDNRVRLRLGGEKRILDLLDEGQTARVELEPEPYRRREQEGHEQWVYRLRLETTTGALYHWVRRFPEPICPTFAFNESIEETFWLGAQLLWLGDPQLLERDVYGIEWTLLDFPPRLAAGVETTIPVRVRNTSPSPWRGEGAARVALSYHWLDGPADGTEWDGERTPAPELEPGEEATVELRLRTPITPGGWTLALDAVYEHVGWFSERAPQSVLRREVEIVPAARGVAALPVLDADGE